MWKLKRYLKPYLGLLFASVALLFGQAMLELALPNYMSNIVNIGLQQGGITQSAPEAIDTETMSLMQMFMSGRDREAVQAVYTPFDKQDDDRKKEFLKSYPNASGKDFLLTGNPEAGAEDAFQRSSYAIVNLLQTKAGEKTDSGEKESEKDTDVSEMFEMLAQTSLTENDREEAIRSSSQASKTILQQTAVMFTRAVYRKLGVNTNAIQNKYIWKTGLEMAGLAILLTACAIGAGFCLARMGAGVGRDLRRDVFRKVTYFENNEMEKFSDASLITRSTNDVTQIQNFLSMGFRMVCFAPIMGIGGLIMGLSTCVSLAWVLALALIVMLGLVMILFSVALPRFKKMQGLIDRLNLVSREELGGLMVVRAFSNQKFMQQRFEKSNKELNDNTLFVNRLMVSMMPIMMFVMNGVSLLIVWFGGKQIAASHLQVGDIMAFIQYAMNVIMSFLFISMMFIMVPRAAVSAERINEILTTENHVVNSEQPAKLLNRVKGVVEFHDVSFHYEGADENVLEHVNFKANPGETVAFIGSTGSGKSTLVNLIPRFYDVTGGKITLDGIDIRDIELEQLRNVIGYVPQKGLLFSGTVSENLRYGNEKAGDELLKQSLDIAQAADFVKNSEKGLEAPVSQGGTNVSGGQRQRLSIARALVKQAPIYIFDDTFSALDFKTDAKLRAALRKYTKNSTVFVVAQRVSTIMHADQILVLDNGKVAGQGTHGELLKNCVTYREIAESQLSKEELE